MKKILIIYAKSTSELLNRQSALGSYILCLASLLEKNQYETWVNGFRLDALMQVNAAGNPDGKSSGIRKIIPAILKQYKRDKNIFKTHETIYKQIPVNVQFDAVLEFYTYGSELGIKLKKAINCPYVLVFDSPVLEEYEFFHGKKRINKNIILKRQNTALKEASSVVVYSRPVKKYVEAITKLQGRINVHQNVDFTRFEFIEPREPTNEINIGFIGSFLKWHRVDLLVQIFESLTTKYHNIRLFLIGAGMEFKTVQKMVNASVVSSRIELTGFCDGGQLLAYKKKLHIGVMPGSNWYGAPNKIFEYGAAGLAVMAPATPTISDLFNDENEILMFDWDNLESAKQALEKLITNHELRKKLQHNLQKKIITNYSEKNTVGFYKNLIDSVILTK